MSIHPKLGRLEDLIRVAEDAERKTKEYDLDDDRLGPVIKARDDAEDTIGNIVADITGPWPEWSSMYGYREAFDECADVLFSAATVHTTPEL